MAMVCKKCGENCINCQCTAPRFEHKVSNHPFVSEDFELEPKEKTWSWNVSACCACCDESDAEPCGQPNCCREANISFLPADIPSPPDFTDNKQKEEPPLEECDHLLIDNVLIKLENVSAIEFRNEEGEGGNKKFHTMKVYYRTPSTTNDYREFHFSEPVPQEHLIERIFEPQ